MDPIQNETTGLGASASTGRDLEALQQRWEKIDPDLDGSAMPVIGRLGLFAGHRERAYVKVLAPFGLSLIDAHTLQLLRLLGPGEAACPSELVGFPFESRAGMTRALDRLESRGLVQRKAHDEDRRRVLVVLTAEGERVSDAFRKAELDFQNHALAGVSDRDRRALCRTLDKMMGNLADFEARDEG